MNDRTRGLLAFALTLSALSAPALAGETPTSAMLGAIDGSRLQVRLTSRQGNLPWTFVTAGALRMRGTAPVVTPMGTLKPSFEAFSAELTQNLLFAESNTFEPKPLESSSALTGGIGRSRANLLRALIGTNYSPTASEAHKAAIQIAVWEIVYDSILDVRAGNFMVRNNSTVTDLAQSFLTTLSISGPSENGLIALNSMTAQDIITIAATVPAPGTFALLALGGFVMARRKR